MNSQGGKETNKGKETQADDTVVNQDLFLADEELPEDDD